MYKLLGILVCSAVLAVAYAEEANIISDTKVVIDGKKVPFRSYHMNIVNVPTFEARLREAEARLGTKPDQSVQIIYERNQENIWFGIITILAAAALISFLLRGSSMTKSSMSTNLFVSGITFSSLVSNFEFSSQT